MREFCDLLDVDRTLRIDDPDNRLIDGDHFADQLSGKPHVGVDEEDMRCITLVEPLREQEVSAFTDFRIRDGVEREIPTSLLAKPGQLEHAAHVWRKERLAVRGRRDDDLWRGHDQPLWMTA